MPLWSMSVISGALLLSIAAILLSAGSGGSEALMAVGLVLVGASAVIGVIVTHGKWARRTVATTLVAGLLAMATVEPTILWWAGVIASAVALFVTLGPPLDKWTRRLPPPEPLPPAVIALPLILLGTPYVAGIVRLDVGWGAAWSLAAVGVAFAFSRAWVPGLWLVRLLVPLATGAAAWAASSWWQAAFTIAWGGLATWLGWTGDAHRAVSPLDPQRVQPKPVFAEFAPQEVRDAAGLDRDGRRL